MAKFNENYDEFVKEHLLTLQEQEQQKKLEHRRLMLRSQIILASQNSKVIKPLWDSLMLLTLVAEIILIPYT